MEKQKSFDKLLRWGGASLIVLLGPLFILLSFLGRDGTTFTDAEKSSLKGKLVYAATFAENWFYDLRTAGFYKHQNKSPNLVILELNDESLNKIGKWPWPRSKHAQVLDHLRAYGAKVVMSDITFSEPDPEQDNIFANAIDAFSKVGRNSVVLSYGVTDEAGKGVEKLPDFLQMSSTISGKTRGSPMPRPQLPDQFNFVAPRYQSSMAAFGFINATPDLDGVFRNYQLVQEMDGTFLPSLGFKGFVDYYSDGKEKQVRVEYLAGGGYLLKLLDKTGERNVHLNLQGELKLRFYGGQDDFLRVPVWKVLEDNDPEHNLDLKAIFGGRAVVYGSSAMGAYDLRHTPVDPVLPGMYMHANLFHDLDERYLYKEDSEGFYASLVLFLLGVAIVLLLSRQRNPLVETGGTLATLAALYVADSFYFAPQGYFIRLFFVLYGTLALYAWFTVLNVFAENREKKKVRDAFSRYVAPEIVKEMLSHPDKLKVGGEKKEITMFFSDVRDFTTISERLTPGDLASFLNFYMGRMTDILFESGGTLDKYIGDAMVAFWGAPLDLPDHAYLAVRGAKLMLEALPEVNKEFERRKLPKANVGIGLNTGEVTVGNMGSNRIFQYTALGDPMNLASRLESQTKEYGVNLMISEFTLKRMGEKANEFRMRPLDKVQVKGKKEAVRIFEVIPNWSPWSKEDALREKFTDAYENKYLKRQFADAQRLFHEILNVIPEDKATKHLLHMTEDFLAKPPPDSWDGTTVKTSK